MKKRWLILLFSLGLVVEFFKLFSIPYIIRQPKTYQHVVKGVHNQGTISAREFADAFDSMHRQNLENVIKEVLRKKTAHEQLREFQSIGRLSFEVPKFVNVDTIFKDIQRLLIVISNRTINVFDELLPSVNLLHNYFNILEEISTGETKKLMRRFRGTYRSLLLGTAREVYGEAEFYRRRGQTAQAHNRITIAQALLYRLKESDEEARKLYKELDTHQPVPFEKEVHEMGIMATGGKR